MIDILWSIGTLTHNHYSETNSSQSNFPWHYYEMIFEMMNIFLKITLLFKLAFLILSKYILTLSLILERSRGIKKMFFSETGIYFPKFLLIFRCFSVPLSDGYMICAIFSTAFSLNAFNSNWVTICIKRDFPLDMRHSNP